jgi:hypothetical protein
MSFSNYSKDFNANMYTVVENQFITKYLPHADGDTVRAYLFGLYLCQCAEDFDADSAAKLLKMPTEKLVDIFSFWEECDLVRVLSKSPLYVEYLPVNAAVGKPKTIRPEKYAQFNREFYKILQRAKKDFKPYEMQRILEFLENNPMEQQAFLLVAEYCVKKDGEKLTANHILNKATKLCKEWKYTCEQVEQDLADYHVHEKELSKIFVLLGIYRKPQDGDYEYLEKWSKRGLETGAVYACAETLKKGTLSTLDQLTEELCEKEIFSEPAAREYLKRREELASVVFKVARKLGVKVQNPRAYSEEYAERWLEHGYDEEGLTLLATVCWKMNYGFPEMNGLIERLYAQGIVDGAGIKQYCTEKDKQLRLIQRMQSYCGVIKKTQSVMEMLSSWQSWNFSDEMILEAAQRSANASAPIPYINKLLSEWKRLGVFTVSEIPERISASPKSDYRKESAIAADLRSDREHHYAVLRQNAQQRAERARAIAEKDEAFKSAETVLKKGEIELARAEIFTPSAIPEIKERIKEAKKSRAEALLRLNLKSDDLIPHYECAKCSDTGFLKNGKMCDCYRN